MVNEQKSVKRKEIKILLAGDSGVGKVSTYKCVILIV